MLTEGVRGAYLVRNSEKLPGPRADPAAGGFTKPQWLTLISRAQALLGR